MKLKALIDFSRPHTIVATSLNILFLTFYAYSKIGTINWVSASIGFFSWISLNFYIVGLNQIFDVEVDKLSKSYLPLPSSRLSMNQAKYLSLAGFFGGWIWNIYQPSALHFWCTLTVYLIGTGYSVPMLKTRESPVMPFLIIVVVRGFFLNFVFWTTLTQLLPDANVIQWISFKVLYVAAIAIFKDIPDLDADRKFGRRTIAVILGEKYSAIISLVLAIAGLFLLDPSIWYPAICSVYLLYRVQNLQLTAYERYQTFWQLLYCTMAKQVIMARYS